MLPTDEPLRITVDSLSDKGNIQCSIIVWLVRSPWTGNNALDQHLRMQAALAIRGFGIRGFDYSRP